MYLNQNILDEWADRPKTIYRYYPNDDAARAAAKALYDTGNKYVMSIKPAAKGRRARLSLFPRRVVAGGSVWR